MPVIDAVPLPSASPSEDRYLGYQRHIGERTAQLAAAIGAAVLEREQGQMISVEIKCRAGELICELVHFKMVFPEFDALARQHGRQVFREYVSAPSTQIKLNEDQIGELIEQALGLLTKIARTKLN
jgi:hypothetical protein